MDSAARDSYLEAQVMTATPQKLRLMLIEGALRFARQTLKHWEEGRSEDAVESLIRTRGIVSELLASVQAHDSELTRTVTKVYVYLFQKLTEAQLDADTERLNAAVNVLEIERETWRQVCEKWPESLIPGQARSDAEREITATASLPAAQSGPQKAAPILDSEFQDRIPPGELMLDA